MKFKPLFLIVLLGANCSLLFSQPTDSFTLNNTVVDFLKKGEYEKALQLVNKEISLNSKYSDAYNLRAWIYCYTNENNKAIADATTSLSIEKKHYTFDTRATAFALNKEYRKAIQDFDNAIALSQEPLYLYKRGLVKLEINDFSGAEMDIKRAKLVDYSRSLHKLEDPLFKKPKYKIPFYISVKASVEEKISIWQQKGEFEKTVDYQTRVNETSRNQMIQQYTNEAIENLKKEYTRIINWDKLTLSQYDADNETFLVQSPEIDFFAINVPASDAQYLKQRWNMMKFSDQDYSVKDNNLVLAKLIITDPENGKKFVFDSKQPTAYAANNITYNFKPIEIHVPQNNTTNTIITENQIVYGHADVDLNIPINNQTNDKTFVVIIANENYSREVSVQYAKNDGRIFKEYCEKTLGIPSKNIHFSQDATFGTMKSEIKWITDVLAAYNGQAKAIFYYAGHGMPNESDLSAYLLPVDGFSSDFETAIKLDDLYERLAKFPSQCVTVFLDACFSGSIRDNGMLANARAVVIKPNSNAIKGKTVVFSAATGKETAFPYKEKQHGLFTYFLLKKLQETKGDVDYQTLYNYIFENVKRQSVVVNQKSQTPQINASEQLQGSWQSLMLM
jgi:tetratricopeptide (TPR) repeat protein